MIQKPVEHYTLGVDLGGTKIQTALVDTNGHILSIKKYPTQAEKGPKKVILNVLTCIEECLNKTKQTAKAVGIGIAAQVNSKGIVRSAPNLKWQNIPLKKKLEAKLEIPVLVTNDVRAATFGEWHYGSGKGINDLAVLFVGTGIGGGIISKGNIITGCSNTGGELGHITIILNGRKCHCPNTGCLEAYAGGWAIAERAQEAIRANPKAGKNLLSLTENIEEITAAHVSQAYHKDDPLASRLVEETGQYLAAGAVSIINALNPCLLILGGGVIEGIPELIEMVKKGVRNKALKAATEDFKIVKATLGDEAGVIGAAALAQSKIRGKFQYANKESFVNHQ